MHADHLNADHSPLCGVQAVVDTTLESSDSAFSDAVPTTAWELRSGEWSACKNGVQHLLDLWYDPVCLLSWRHWHPSFPAVISESDHSALSNTDGRAPSRLPTDSHIPSFPDYSRTTARLLPPTTRGATRTAQVPHKRMAQWPSDSGSGGTPVTCHGPLLIARRGRHPPITL